MSNIVFYRTFQICSPCHSRLASNPNPCTTICDTPCPIKLKYIQPERVKSFKPPQNYTQINIPMESCTIYKNSFVNNDPNITKCVRQPPIKPEPQLKLGHEKLDTTTVTNVIKNMNNCFRINFNNILF